MNAISHENSFYMTTPSLNPCVLLSFVVCQTMFLVTSNLIHLLRSLFKQYTFFRTINWNVNQSPQKVKIKNKKQRGDFHHLPSKNYVPILFHTAFSSLYYYFFISLLISLSKLSSNIWLCTLAVKSHHKTISLHKSTNYLESLAGS